MKVINLRNDKFKVISSGRKLDPTPTSALFIIYQSKVMYIKGKYLLYLLILVKKIQISPNKQRFSPKCCLCKIFTFLPLFIASTQYSASNQRICNFTLLYMKLCKLFIKVGLSTPSQLEIIFQSEYLRIFSGGGYIIIQSLS